MSSENHPALDTSKWASLHAAALPLLDRVIAHADELQLGISKSRSGAVIVDAGIEARGGLEAGRLIAELCLGGLGSVSLQTAGVMPQWPLTLHVHAANPILACLGSQYAGWSLNHGEGKEAFYSLGSGPGRALAVKEPLFTELGYKDSSERTYLVLEVDKNPPEALIDKIVSDCGLASAENLTIILTPTASIAGGVQIVGRVLEVAMHKIHELGFPLAQVLDGSGSAPVPPPIPDFVKAMGRTNDAILFAGQVQVYVEAEDDDARDLAEKLPSSASRDYGRPFAEIFKEVNYDFFKVDPMLFSPAKVVVTNVKSGNSFHAGALAPELLNTSFGL